MTTVLVQVRRNDRDEFQQLLSEHDLADVQSSEVELFTGEQLVEYLLPASQVLRLAFPLITRIWSKRKKYSRVVINGRVYEGISAEEIVKIESELTKAEQGSAEPGA